MVYRLRTGFRVGQMGCRSKAMCIQEMRLVLFTGDHLFVIASQDNLVNAKRLSRDGSGGNLEENCLAMFS